MCGIVGIISSDSDRIDGIVTAMAEAVVHRGPDDSGLMTTRFDRTTVGLGHRRLSILDLSPDGHQPMVDPETGAVLIYNGELYNYVALRRDLESEGCRFRGRSDTEVLLQALVRWGPDALDRTCGMFAFAFLEPSLRRLVVARDPLGIKPLYLARVPGAVLLASEIRALLASGLVPRRVHRRGVSGFLAYGAVQEPDTIVEGIEAFPPGCWGEIDLDADPPGLPAPRRYWTIPDPSPCTAAEAIERYRATFDVAVGEHLASDVPLAVLLSSGLDSTVVAGIAARHATDLRTFTIGFADHPDFDESPLAEETAGIFGARHTTVSVTEAECEALVEVWLESLDQPSMDGLNVYLISKFIADQGITVVLSGLGGDEMFGGYPSFRDVPRLLRTMRAIRPVPRRWRGAIAAVAAVGRSAAVRQKLADILRSDGDVLSLCLHRRRTMSDGQLSRLGIDAADLGLHPLFVPMPAVEQVKRRPEPIWMVSQVESRFYQSNVLLRDCDTNGMAHSLEMRVPFLDRRVLDFAFALPDDVRLPAGRADKHLTRVTFDDLVRPALARQAKRGFALPIRRWMRGPLADLCGEGLHAVASSGLVRPEGVDAVWSAFQSEPESPIWSRAWSLCILGIYLRRQGLVG